jgi:adenylate cyclase
MRDRIRAMFGRYVDRRIAEHLINSQILLGERRVVSVMFCDLEGLAALSERVDPERRARA